MFISNEFYIILATEHLREFCHIIAFLQTGVG